MAIFYRKDRFEPREFDHFWLSDTPNVVASTTWGNSNRRMVNTPLPTNRRTKTQSVASRPAENTNNSKIPKAINSI